MIAAASLKLKGGAKLQWHKLHAAWQLMVAVEAARVSGPFEMVLKARFDATPLGAASIAQVHSARLTAAAARNARLHSRSRRTRRRGGFGFVGGLLGGGRRKPFSREVVVKVQRPGAKQLVLRDLATLHGFTKLVGRDVSWDVDMVSKCTE